MIDDRRLVQGSQICLVVGLPNSLLLTCGHPYINLVDCRIWEWCRNGSTKHQYRTWQIRRRGWRVCGLASNRV